MPVLGGHAVGMSTVLECIAARWVGLEVCGVSLVTNAGAGYTGEPLTHEEVLAAGLGGGPRLARVIRRFVAGPAGRGGVPIVAEAPASLTSRHVAGAARAPVEPDFGRSATVPRLMPVDGIPGLCRPRGRPADVTGRSRSDVSGVMPAVMPPTGIRTVSPRRRARSSINATRAYPYPLTGSSRPAAFAAAAFSAQASRTRSLCGRMGQCSSRLLNSSQ